MTTKNETIANYTTKVAVEKTVAEITKLLAGAKTTAILSEYDGGSYAP